MRLAVNRLGETGSWGLPELEAEFKELIIAEAPIERSCFGSDEIDQLYVDLIVRRYQTRSGMKATLDGSGQTFDQLKRLRAKV